MSNYRCFLRWPDFKRKAVTLSYDDGLSFDEKLVEIMNKYGLKGTFNLNSGRIDKWGAVLKSDVMKKLYVNHEVAVHGEFHHSLAEIDSALAVKEVLSDREGLERIFGGIVKGMAYPNGAVSVSENVLDILKVCGINYSRTTTSTYCFEIPENFLLWDPTMHHTDAKLTEYVKIFLERKDTPNCWQNHPMIFYLWGHSYEFNNDNNWDVIENFGKGIGNRDDIFYATNGEIYEYVQAFDRLVYSIDGKTVYNPSAKDVYICYFGKNYLIPAGKTVNVEYIYED